MCYTKRKGCSDPQKISCVVANDYIGKISVERYNGTVFNSVFTLFPLVDKIFIKTANTDVKA